MSQRKMRNQVYVAGGPSYPFFATGEIQGAVVATRMPDIKCDWVKLKALAGNDGSVYVGGGPNVTIPDGTTDEVAGWPLAAGEETGWIAIANVNLMYYICDNEGDDFVFMLVR